MSIPKDLEKSKKFEGFKSKILKSKLSERAKLAKNKSKQKR